MIEMETLTRLGLAELSNPSEGGAVLCLTVQTTETSVGRQFLLSRITRTIGSK